MKDSNILENLRQQWNNFRNGKVVDTAIIRPEILASWERCRNAGLDQDKIIFRELPQTRLEEVFDTNRNLMKVSARVMQSLYETISVTRSLVSLSDAAGIVLLTLWDKAGEYPIPQITPGRIIREETSGTNAISLSLIEKCSYETRGSEHYCQTLHRWFCSAAPIIYKGKMAGVLNISLPVQSFHHHTRGMMEIATFAIAEQLRLIDIMEEQKNTLEMLDEGVILFDELGTIRSINRTALKLFGLNERQQIPKRLDEIISSEDILSTLLGNASFRDQEAIFSHNYKSIHCVLSLCRSGNDVSRVLTIRGGKRIAKTAANFSGAKAIYTFDNIIGNAPSLKAVMELASVAAKNDVTTLILGESGTGKELFAQAIHNAGTRAGAPFVVVNCGALPKDLVESELFGYEEGAFTGANRLGKPGKFELADSGTIFLDEIGEMPLAAQASLLRVIQSGEVIRIGSKIIRHVNVRILAATNRNLFDAIKQNLFREDLFYRLNVFTVTIPPLRDRPGDIELLANCFLSRFSKKIGHASLKLSPRLLQIIKTYDWPGNIRELENAIERMAYMAKNDILDIDLLPAYISQNLKLPQISGEERVGLLLKNEKDFLVRVIQENNGNLRAAAKALGISRSGIYVKLKRYGIDPGNLRNQDI